MTTPISPINESDKVIVGSDGWLFLCNDSNNSTAQFTGEINLSDQSIEKFQVYLTAIKNKIACDFFFSISPNKEYVHPEKYPFLIKEKSNGKPLVHEQAISILNGLGIKVHYPVGELAQIPNSYYKTDTHWSEFGAYTTLRNFFLSNYNFNLVELFSQNFSMEYVSGDLGSKLDGRKDGRLSYNFKIDEYEVFNSGLKNHGYGVHYVNPNAPIDRKILVFGDSFGISYIKPLVLTFKEVVFLYSPATFIENVYENFLPDIVIFQINQRFLLDPPSYRYNLYNSLVFKKFKSFNLDEIKRYKILNEENEKTSMLKELYIKELRAIISKEDLDNDLSENRQKSSLEGESRWDRAKRILTPLREQINAHVSRPIFIDNTDDFNLFDEYSKEFPGVGKKNFLLIHKSVSIFPESILMEGSGNVIVVSSGVSLSKSKIYAAGKNGLIFLGLNTRLTKCSIRLGSRGNCFSVGENTTWEGGSASVLEDNMCLEIGRNCMLSANIEMMTSDKHPIFDRSTGERLNKPKSIIIEDNVWLGRNVKITKGVHLKQGCIIGQGSLVTKSTKPYCAYAGIPARLIRENVEWRRSLKVKNIDPNQTDLS